MLKGEFAWCHDSFLIIATIAIALLLPLAHQTVGEEVASSTPFPIALPNCPEKCGDVPIPYPFGIGDGCHYNPPEDGLFYNITCDNVVPRYGNVEVKKITLEGEFRVRNFMSYICYDGGVETSKFPSWIQVTRFALSTTQNIAGAIGCDTIAFFSGERMNRTNGFTSGCVTGCSDLSDVSNQCSGIGCCLASIPDGVTNITLGALSIFNHTNVQSFNPCSVTFVVAKDQIDEVAHNEMPFSISSIVKQNVTYFLNDSNLLLPMVYNWSIGTKDCETARAAEEHLCKGNSVCRDNLPGQWGYRCECKKGFQGNPYLYDCQDIDECANITTNICEKQEYCHNILGDYRCRCPKGYSGNGTQDNHCTLIDTASQKKLLLAIKIIVGVGGGIIVSLLCCFWFQWRHGNKKLQKMRETYFHQNGGHILQQKLLARDVSVGNMVRMFTVEELKKATDNYSENSMIGRGGFGMVYKGTVSIKEMSPNNQVVAIKKSIKIDSAQVEQFINEVVALSQINNKNVVKLLGCCLETEVPLLVYEYISNGTLHNHLHDEGKMSATLSWDVRLRIASEVAEVLAYLHTTISIPIIHRDIKSANILLDDKYTAKVADFGASKLAPVDQEQLGTMVQGTCGYLDPEYMQTGELTDKSDVYSFGVVLVELLTREKAISYAKPETERSLAVCFLRKLKEHRLFEILDDKIVSDSTIEKLKEVAYLARRCLKLKGEDRPTMKEVAKELDRIRGMGTHPWSPNNGVLLQEESEYLLGETQVLNSGFGNEGLNDSLNSQSRIVQLVPMDDGR